MWFSVAYEIFVTRVLGMSQNKKNKRSAAYGTGTIDLLFKKLKPDFVEAESTSNSTNSIVQNIEPSTSKNTLVQAVQEQDIQEAEAEQIGPETSNILKENVFDVGYFISRMNSIDSFTRYQLITNHWVPDKYYSFPYSIHGKRGREEKRRVNHGHLEKFNWLVFSNEKQGLFWKYCAVFLPEQLVGGQKNVIPKKFVTEPLTKYAKLSGKDGDLNHHQQTNYHREAVTKGTFFPLFLI